MTSRKSKQSTRNQKTKKLNKLTKLKIILTSAIAIVGFFGVTAATEAINLNSVHLPSGNSHRKSCNTNQPGVADCTARVILDKNGSRPLATVSFTNGYAPADLSSAYNLPNPSTGAVFVPNGRTVAIVDAYDNPNAANDLLAYRQQFNLPLCSTANASPTATDLTSCFFTKVNQNGAAAPLPAASTSWGPEIDLDVQMVSATCPSCKILLVEANSANFTDLGAGVNAAAALKANAISNSYGGKEFSSETSSTYANFYNHPGIAVTASTGDSGYGVQFPASSPYVTAVGGTSLTKAINVRGWSETAWSGAGSGCSAYVNGLSYQTKIGTCTKREVADVSAVADPNTGVAVYDSYGSTGGANWFVYGGTSVASPIIASLYGLAGNTGVGSTTVKYNEYVYSHKASLNDVTGGSNGTCTTTSNGFFGRTSTNTANKPLCTAVAGYDGPTGLGSPNGFGAF